MLQAIAIFIFLPDPFINRFMPVDFIILTNVASPVWQRAIGAYQVAAHCRQNGISCQVIDFIDLFRVDELENIISACIGSNTIAIGISTTFFFNEYTQKKFVGAKRDSDQVMSVEFRTLLQKLKQKFPNIKIIGGGANSFMLEQDNLFDVVFHGYSEQSVVEYLQQTSKRIWPIKGTTTIIDGKYSNFNIASLSHQWASEDCILPQETLPIEISRGCIFKCKFCSYPLNGKKKLDYLRDTDKLKDELIYNYENYGTTNYYFADDTFNDSTYKLEQLHSMLLGLPFKIKFVTYLRLDLLHAHQEQISMLKEMGLGTAFFGIESLNHESGKKIGKGMKPEIIKEFLLDLYYNHWEQKIPITCSFIIGLPGESQQSIQETYEWCKNTPFNDLWFPLFIKQDGHYYSEFDKNFMNYGYSIDSNGDWYNEHMTYQDALLIAEEFNKKGLYNNNTPSGWFLFSLLSYGFTIEELQNKKISDLHWPQIVLKKLNLFKKYKEKLLKEIQK